MKIIVEVNLRKGLSKRFKDEMATYFKTSKNNIIYDGLTVGVKSKRVYVIEVFETIKQSPEELTEILNKTKIKNLVTYLKVTAVMS